MTIAEYICDKYRLDYLQEQSEYVSRHYQFDSLDAIIEFGSICFGVPSEVLKSKAKGRDIVIPRQLIHWLASRHGYSLTLIGKATGDRDHSTVLHSKRIVNGFIDNPIQDRRITPFYLKMAEMCPGLPRINVPAPIEIDEI
jgi:Bacterial dnaA protein helix-turn-helix